MQDLSPTWTRRFLRLAREVASWSKDPKGGVGAVLVDERKRVIGLGFNGFPDRIPDDPALLADPDEKLPRMIHAEMNAVLNATRSVQGAALFTTLTPCAECAKLLIQAGVARIYRLPHPGHRHTRWTASFATAERILAEAGVPVTTVEPGPDDGEA
ncbi:MAG TPA: deaminase [Caulobacteraceae bacterium]|nr:deaminase [Caulobacteraceae bacterium]